MTVCYNNYFVIISDITSILKETPNERELLRPLIDIRHKWYDIGLTLQVRRNDLDDLKQSEDDDITKLKKVINIWKGTERSSVTWKGVINAMKSPDNKMIVNRIHCHLKLGNLLLSNKLILSINYIVQTLRDKILSFYCQRV